MSCNGRVGLMVLIIFLASPEGHGLGIGQGREETRGGNNGRIQIQEQDLSPSPFKTFLEQEQQQQEKEGGGDRNANNRFNNRFSSSPEWETVIDPKLYIITEYDENSLPNQNSKPNELSESETSEESAFARLRRNSNNGHSLSIVNPLDVLRQRLLLEIARRRNLKQNQHQIIANAEILKNIG